MTCVWLACMRPSETEAKQCELFFRIDGEAIHLAREYESLHQFVLRGISRNFDSTETQTVYVFDEWQASYLTDNIEYIDLYHKEGSEWIKEASSSASNPVQCQITVNLQ